MPNKELYTGLQVINICRHYGYSIEGYYSRYEYNEGLNRNIGKVYVRIKGNGNGFVKLAAPACSYHNEYEDLLFEDAKIFPKKYRKYFVLKLIQIGPKGNLVIKEKRG